METDFLVIGSGISGLNFAINAAKKGRVLIVTKKKLVDSNTNYAQGGIAAVLSKTDNIEKHIKDTMETGCFHNKEKAVRLMIENSRSAIFRLIELGVEFEKEKGELKLVGEGGHTDKRVAYVGDYTGKEIEKILVRRTKEHPNIKILENAFALDLLVKNKTCYGVQIIHEKKTKIIYSAQTIIATGGIGELFKETTNPKIATGDGLAMCIRGGCRTKDLEFIQFHPTALDKKTFPRFLISEAVRGEGAHLVNSRNERFMNKFSKKELEPRDLVAREIYRELKKGPVYLDITHKKEAYLKKRFPIISEKLKKFGYNMAKDKIPITPAVHYICGGVKTNLRGQTAINNLYAFGEVAYTGVHGANRLASNSLLEAFVFSNQIIKTITPTARKKAHKHPKFHNTVKIAANSAPETKEALILKKQIKSLMWEYAGIVRNLKETKEKGIPNLEKINKRLNQIKKTNTIIAESKNMALAGLEILKAVTKRKKSLGCHFIFSSFFS